MLPDTEEINSLLDVLYLEMLHLIEQKTAISINIEKILSDGKLSIAKTRYIQGTQAASSAQLPTVNSAEFNALNTVIQEENDDYLLPCSFTLKSNEINKEQGFQDPLRFFSILAPNSLRTAAKEFRKVLNYIIEDANLKTQLHTVINDIKLINFK